METILRRERLIIGGCLAAMVLVAWSYLLYSRAAMPDMDMPGMVMPELHEWGLMAVLLLFVMWAVMMVAMMLPSAAPMILAFLTLNHRRQTTARPLLQPGTTSSESEQLRRQDDLIKRAAGERSAAALSLHVSPKSGQRC